MLCFKGKLLWFTNVGTQIISDIPAKYWVILVSGIFAEFFSLKTFDMLVAYLFGKTQLILCIHGNSGFLEFVFVNFPEQPKLPIIHSAQKLPNIWYVTFNWVKK